MYRSERMLTSAEWLEHFESLRGYLTATWDGLIIVIGDINVDLLRPNKPITSQYQDILSSLNLHQHVHKPTRTTDKTSTLIDHNYNLQLLRMYFAHWCPSLSFSQRSSFMMPSIQLLTSKLPDSKQGTNSWEIWRTLMNLLLLMTLKHYHLQPLLESPIWMKSSKY